jgi:hypothetical protein
MSRPIDTSKYVKGEPCAKCGGTLRYIKGPCDECMRRHNARKAWRRAVVMTPPLNPTIAPATISQTKLINALAGYSRSPGALMRSAHLDALILKKPRDEAKPLTGGERYRASLPVGYHASGTMPRDEQHAADRAELVEAVGAILDDLPDLVTHQDVATALPRSVVDAMGQRLTLAISAALKAHGAVSRETTPAANYGRHVYYVLRNPLKYEPLVGLALHRAYDAAASDGNFAKKKSLVPNFAKKEQLFAFTAQKALQES